MVQNTFHLTHQRTGRASRPAFKDFLPRPLASYRRHPGSCGQACSRKKKNSGLYGNARNATPRRGCLYLCFQLSYIPNYLDCIRDQRGKPFKSVVQLMLWDKLTEKMIERKIDVTSFTFAGNFHSGSAPGLSFTRSEERETTIARV